MEGRGNAVGSRGDCALATLAQAFKVEFCDVGSPRDTVTPLDPTEFNLERSRLIDSRLIDSRLIDS
eukprot:1983410-Pyramimonas_sp.AAC.1